MWNLRRSGAVLSLPEQIADMISEAIIEGSYKPGQRIPEQQVAEAFKVSRGPVREALRLLEAEGLVVVLPRRGAQVTNLTIHEVDENFQIRAALLGLAARLLTERQTPETKKRVHALLQDLESVAKRAGDLNDYTDASLRMTLFFAEASENRKLQAMMSSLARQTMRYTRLALSEPSRRVESARKWKALVGLVERCEADKAELFAADMVRESGKFAGSLLARQEAENTDGNQAAATKGSKRAGRMPARGTT
jgi:DNA-binding GntR family transcriptional regulator